MKKFRIKVSKPDKEKEILNLKDELVIKDSIDLECKVLRGVNDCSHNVVTRTWFIDENDVLYPQKFIYMHYEEIK